MKYIKVFLFILFYICNNAFGSGITEFPPKNVSSQASGFNDTTTDNSGQVMTGKLRELCKQFGIPIHNCTCKLFNYQGEKRSVCGMLNDMITINIYHPVFNTAYASMLFISAIIGMTGNLLVLVVAINHRKDIVDYKKLVALLAFYDFLFSLLNLCLAIPKFWTTDWVYGRFLCKFMISVEYLGTALAIGMILLISAERYIGIVTPFSKGFSDYRLLLSNSLNGLIAVFSVTPLFVNLDFDPNSNDSSKGTCELKWENVGKDSLTYNSLKMIFYFLIPLIIIVSVLNLRIILKLSQRRMLESDSGIADPRQRLKRYKEYKRTIVILLTVVISFALLVFPKHLIYILFDLKGWAETGPTEINDATYYILLYIAYLPYPFHATVNPIIYSLVGKGWRKKMKRIILRKSRSPSYFNNYFNHCKKKKQPSS